MNRTIEGTYRDGKIELAEKPVGIDQAKVLVTFLAPASQLPKRRQMTFGQFAGSHPSSEEDFKIAEWRGESPNGD